VPLDKKGQPITGKKAQARFLVYQDDMEIRNPAADPEFLDKLARRSDGEAHLGDEQQFAKFLQELRNKPLPQGSPKPDLWPDWKRNPKSRDLDDQVEALWTSGILACFLTFVAIVCAEWYLRRRWGLV
jgi:hypothetical protein